MKNRSLLRSRQDHANPRRGVALLLVLSCLVLLAALILGFLLAGQNNLKSSKLYANGASVKTLADSTVSLVMAQIQQATSNGTQVAWASQPGMIRTYDNNGLPINNFRLYSWDAPMVPGTTDPSTTDTGSLTSTSAPWYRSPALFFDLNQPVKDNAQILHYPIVDGNPNDLGSYTTVSGTTVSTYTMPNPGAGGGTVPAIEGFWVNQANSGIGPAVNAARGGSALTASNISTNLIPMPVKWLYVLKDGTIVTPVATGVGTQVTVAGASTTNPIVGRISYWTDDETSKVNINTASEGAYWDQPRSQGVTDINLATMQPVQNEFQRYPGHPAMTSLSTVFGSLAYVDPTRTASNPVRTSITGTLSFTPYQFYYDLAPKLNADTGVAVGATPASAPDNQGSRAGTVVWYYSGFPTASVPNATGSGTIGGYLTAKNAGTGTAGTTGGDRLFASVDELLFTSNLFDDNAHKQSTTVTGTTVTGIGATRPVASTNTVNTSASVTITPDFLEKAKFFLTASSRAPDVNLFNQPRVVTWPLNAATTIGNSDPAYWTTLDAAIAWCGSLNSQKNPPYQYFFTRQRNDHPTNDLPSATGASGQLGRNRTLMNYLANLTSQNIPGFGGRFGDASSVPATPALPASPGNTTAKYPSATITIGSINPKVSERDQILTEIFDYIRCLNLQDNSSITASGTLATFHQFAPVAYSSPPYNYTSGVYADMWASSSYPDLHTGLGDIGSNYTTAPGINTAGKGQVVPIFDTVTNTKGFGRFPTVAEVSIMFVVTGWNDGRGGLSSDPNYFAPSASTSSSTSGTVTTTSQSPNTTAAMSGTEGTLLSFTTTKTTGSGTNTVVLSSTTTTGYFAPWGYYNDGTNTHDMTLTTDRTGTLPGPAFNKTYMASTTGYPNSLLTSLTGTSLTSGTPPVTTVTGTLQIKPIVLVSFFDPSCGFVSESPTWSFQISGLDQFKWKDDGTPMFASATGPGVATDGSINPQGGGPNYGNNAVVPAYSNMPGLIYPAKYSQGWGGNLGFRQYITGNVINTVQTFHSDGGYPFIGTAHNFKYNPVTATRTNMGTPFQFQGGPITINILLPSAGSNGMVDSRWVYGGSGANNATRQVTPNWPPTNWPLTGTSIAGLDLTPIQQIKLYFPDATLPLPAYAAPADNSNGGTPLADRGNFFSRLGASANGDFSNVNIEFTALGDVIRSVRAVPGDMRIIAGRLAATDIPGQAAPAPGLFDPTQTLIKLSGLTAWDYSNSSVFQVHSMVDSLNYPFYGAILGQLVPGAKYANSATATPSWTGGASTSTGMGNIALGTGALIPLSLPNILGSWTAATNKDIAGDFDNGFAFVTDGPYINKPDEGQADYWTSADPSHIQVPYFGNAGWLTSTNSGVSYFSPNRMMPGPGMFGSLSTGVIRNIPWMTLLFCPNPEGGPKHPGFGLGSGTTGPLDAPPYSIPPDHLWMDLFTMPVVEPYPISEPLSTAGRINMNYQIMPFTYIERSTGVRAVLKSERIIAVSDDAAAVYKTISGDGSGTGTASGFDFRLPINLDQTLLGFDNFFNTPNPNTGVRDIFRSATQICNMFLYPSRDTKGQDLTTTVVWDALNANINKFWYGNATPNGAYAVSTAAPTHFLTGDNSRERPYTTIYPRLTTKSNTFTVHYCVETLKKVATSASQGIWDETTDQVTGQYRGSTTIERYVDPNDSTLIDFADPSNATTGNPNYATALDKWYKFRVVSTKQFAP